MAKGIPKGSTVPMKHGEYNGVKFNYRGQWFRDWINKADSEKSEKIRNIKMEQGWDDKTEMAVCRFADATYAEGRKGVVEGKEEQLRIFVDILSKRTYSAYDYDTLIKAAVILRTVIEEKQEKAIADKEASILKLQKEINELKAIK